MRADEGGVTFEDGRRVARLRGGYPEVLSPVTLVLVADEGTVTELETRVSDVTPRDAPPTAITVVRPQPAHREEVEAPPVGTTVELTWLHAAGVMRTVVEVTPVWRRYGPVWVLTPQGEVTRQQRREFFRVPVSLPVGITSLVEWNAALGSLVPTAGMAVDLSEGGLRAVARGVLPSSGSTVELALKVPDETLDLPATVVRSISFPGGSNGLAMRFTATGRHADRIRALVFAAQRRAAGKG